MKICYSKRSLSFPKKVSSQLKRNQKILKSNKRNIIKQVQYSLKIPMNRMTLLLKRKLPKKQNNQNQNKPLNKKRRIL